MLFSKKRDILAILAMIIIAVLGFFIFKLIGSGGLDGLRSNFANDWQDFLLTFRIIKDNTKDLAVPQRKPPLSVLASQESLKQNLAFIFAEFKEDDWKYFWNLIYGIHVTNDFGKEYSPKRKRQLSIEEIEDTLAYDYPQSFGRFNDQMWLDFWKVVFKNY